MIIDTSCYPTNLVDLASFRGEPFSGERLIEVMDPYSVTTASRAASTRRSFNRRKATRSIRGPTVNVRAASRLTTTWRTPSK